jgi:hypothetical protein
MDKEGGGEGAMETGLGAAFVVGGGESETTNGEGGARGMASGGIPSHLPYLPTYPSLTRSEILSVECIIAPQRVRRVSALC